MTHNQAKNQIDLDALERQIALRENNDPEAFGVVSAEEAIDLIAELRAARRVIEAVRHDTHAVSYEVADAIASYDNRD